MAKSKIAKTAKSIQKVADITGQIATQFQGEGTKKVNSIKKVADITSQIASHFQGEDQEDCLPAEEVDSCEDVDSGTALQNVSVDESPESGYEGVTAIMPSDNPMQNLQNIVAAYSNYKVIESQEITKRHDIEAHRDVELEKIRSVREIFLQYLDKSFDERKKNFAGYFKQLDKAVANQDVGAINAVLQGIMSLAATSPFRDLKALQDSLKDPDTEFEV